MQNVGLLTSDFCILSSEFRILSVLLAILLIASQAATPAAGDAVSRGRAVLAALAGKQFSAIEAQFTDEMKAALPPGRLEAVWTALGLQFGVHKGCASASRVVEIADKKMVITPCEFERRAIDVQVAFNAAGQISGMQFRPSTPPAPAYAAPAYVNPAGYKEQEVKLGSPEWELPATLTLPAGDKSYPAVVLVHGSGPNDRDETLGPNKPFKDLALGLASRGIAVLRYDKRSKVHGQKMAGLKTLTVKEEVVDDAVAAIQWLGAHPSIYPDRIFVLGHSLGGTLIPRILQAAGERKAGVAGGIVFAGAARSLDAAIVEQLRYVAMLDGAISPEEQKQIDTAVQGSAAVQALTARDAAEGVVISGVPASYWLDLRGYDAPAAAAALKTKLLVLQGERDYQVTMADFERWRRALSGRRDVTFRSYPALDHRFMAGTGPSRPQDYDTPSHVADEVIRDIAAWVLGG